MSSALLKMEFFQNKYSSSPAIRHVKIETWVAQILGINNYGSIRKRFLKGMVDYTDANSVGSRGGNVNFILLDNQFYEINQQIGWKKERHYFCRVKNGNIIEIELSEVLRCLSSI